MGRIFTVSSYHAKRRVGLRGAGQAERFTVFAVHKHQRAEHTVGVIRNETAS